MHIVHISTKAWAQTAIRVRAGRVLVTDNVADFLPLPAQLLEKGRHHARMLLAVASKYPRAKRTLGLWVTALDAYLTVLPDGPSLEDTCAWL